MDASAFASWSFWSPSDSSWAYGSTWGKANRIWSPHWLANAWESATDWLQWNQNTTENIFHQVPDLQLTLPAPPPSTLTLPTSLPTQ